MNRLLALSASARRALLGCAVLAALGAVALVGQAWALAGVLADIVDGGGAPTGERLGVLAGAVLARAVFGWATQVVAARAAAGAKAELRAILLDRSLAAGPEWVVRAGPAELTALATRGLDALDGYFSTYLPALVNAAVLPAGIGAVILLADWPSALVIALTLPLVPVFAILIGLRTRDRVADAADATGRLSAHLLELARALPVLTAFRRAATQSDAVRRVSDAHRRATMGTLRVAFASALVLELIATLSVALVAVTIGLRLVSGDLGLAVGLFVLILAPECYLPLRAAGAAHHASEDGLEAARRVAEVPVTSTRPGTKPPVGDVEVTGLTVSRRAGNAPDGLSLTARPGEIIRLDSPSGSGKSTLFAVLLGFVEPTGGTVRVGGVDLADLDLAAWRRRIAWVPQQPRFAGGTVADETDHAAAAAVGVAHLLDRPLAELSTGERQRVAVARALTRVREGADLLLLDEPTAHLDPAVAGRVMAAVEEAAAGGVAVILAAHRTVESTSDSTVTQPGTARGTLSVGPRSRLRALLDRRLLGGAGLGAAALVAGVALTVTSAWLIAKAAEQPPILTLSVAVVGVRAFGLGRAVLRYLERLVTHDAVFRAAGDLRVGLWRALVRRGPAHSRTDDLARLVEDIDTVRDLTPRVLTPPLVAALVCVVAVLTQLAILPAAAIALAIAVAVAGLGAPAAALALDRHAGTALASGRRRIATGTLTLLDASAELIAFGAHHSHRAELATTDAFLTRSARREAFGAGAATLVITLATGAAAVAGTALAATAVAAGTLDPLLAPVCALLPLALAEVLAPIVPAAQHRNALREALSRTQVESVPGRTAAALVRTRCQVDGVPEYADGRVELRELDWPFTESRWRDNTLDVPAVRHRDARRGAMVRTRHQAGTVPERTDGRVGLPEVEVGWPGAEPAPRDVTRDVAAVRPRDAIRAPLARHQIGPVLERTDGHVEPNGADAGLHGAEPYRRDGTLDLPVVQRDAGRAAVAGTDPELTDGRVEQHGADVGWPGVEPKLRDYTFDVAAVRHRDAICAALASHQTRSVIEYANGRVEQHEADVGSPGAESRLRDGTLDSPVVRHRGARRPAVVGTDPEHTDGRVELHGSDAGSSGAEPALRDDTFDVPVARHRDARRAALARTRQDGPVLAHTDGRVELRGVDVGWPGAEPALLDVTLDVPAGTHVAVVGPSGSGKSTLLALLLGFLEPERGTARIPRFAAWCPQEPQLASTTVRENLRVGDPDATDDQLAAALTQAGLADWIDRLDTRLTGGTAATSGGEAQRLALARALLAAPRADVVLLDEPTAHLDTSTADAVLRVIRELPMTVIHVTHRADEAAQADLIVEIAHNRVHPVRMVHSHPQGSPGEDVTEGGRQGPGTAVGTALA